jgi:hypothetical protein
MWYSFTSLVQKQAPVTQKMVLGVQIREPRDQSPVTRTRVRRPEIGRFGGQARIQYRSGCMRRLAQAREGVNQDCTATPQGGPLMAPVVLTSGLGPRANNRARASFGAGLPALGPGGGCLAHFRGQGPG